MCSRYLFEPRRLCDTHSRSLPCFVLRFLFFSLSLSLSLSLSQNNFFHLVSHLRLNSTQSSSPPQVDASQAFAGGGRRPRDGLLGTMRRKAFNRNDLERKKKHSSSGYSSSSIITCCDALALHLYLNKHTLASLDKAFASEIAVRQDHILTQGFPQRYKTSFKSKTLFHKKHNPANFNLNTNCRWLLRHKLFPPHFPKRFSAH